MNTRSRMTLKSSVVFLWALKTSAVSLTSAASATSLASTASTALFPQKTSWSWWFDHQWHQKDQYQTFCVEWIIKNRKFYWCMVSFLLEAVEASLCHFFENWLMKLKFPNLLNPLWIIIQWNDWSFYPSELNYFSHFNMRYPVCS